MFKEGIREILVSLPDIVNSMGQNSGLLADLNSWNGSIYGFSEAIANGVVKPVAYTLFSLVALLELIHATQRASAAGGGGSVYTVQQICMVLIKFVFCKLAIDYSTSIVALLFALTGQITQGVAGYIGSGEIQSSIDVDALLATVDGWDIGQQLSTLLSLKIVELLLLFAKIFITTIVTARFIELYVYNAMAPLSLATFGNQELHGIGINFLKSYFAVSLQGTVLYFVIGCYPALAAGIGDNATSISATAWGMVSKAIILLVAVLGSGKFVKAITNAMM